MTSPTLTIFGWVGDAMPAHVGDVQEGVGAVQVDEGSEVGE